MALTHVCVWDKTNGYRHIMLEEACNIPEYKYRTVSAEEGVFVCELCAQTVCLTAPGKQSRNFRHNSASEKKKCEDRASIYAYNKAQDECHPVLPLRIEESQGSYLLALGFFHKPTSNISGAQSPKIIITGDSGQKFVHSFERLSSQGITYLNVGNVPSTKYKLSYEHISLNLSKYWPSTTVGIDSERGSFFDYSSGKMLQPGSKAYINQDYYLLQRQRILDVPYGISCKSIAENRINFFTTWYLYKIHVQDFSAPVARFFLKHSIFLTEKPATFYPVWPPYIEDPYFMYQNYLAIYVYLQANDADFKITPHTYVQHENLKDGKLYKIYRTIKEQHLLSLGQLGSIKSAYLMTKKLDMVAAFPEVQIKSIGGKLISEDTCNQLPKGKQISIQAPFDGKVILLKNDKILEIRHIVAEEILTIDELSFGCEVRIFQGCDMIRIVKFEKTKNDTDTSALDRQLVEKLRSCKGALMPVPHSIGAVVGKLTYFPLTKEWFCSKTKEGRISHSNNGFALWLHPFTEDLQIEPRSLYHYAYPVFTECFVDQLPSVENMDAGEETVEYDEFKPDSKYRAKMGPIKKLGLSRLMLSRLEKVLADAKCMGAISDTSMECLFGMLPMCVLSGKQEALAEFMDSEKNIKSEVQAELQRYIEE